MDEIIVPADIQMPSSASQSINASEQLENLSANIRQ